MNHSFKVLKRNRFFYDYFINKKILKVKEELSDEEVLERTIFLVKFSWRNHSGYYSDGRIENILFDYGETLDRYVDKKKIENDVERIFFKQNDYTILHVATELGEVGGHTRVLYQFLKRYEDHNQIVVLTDQSIKDAPQWFVKGIRNIPIVTLDPITSLFERAYVLRFISGFTKKVILYHHPYDVVPIIAFSHSKCPPVLIENHSHSWFWLGPSIADLVFTHTDFHKAFTLRTRPVDNVYCLPLTQIDNLEIMFDRKDKVKAKEKLKINTSIVCLIAVGTPEKFIPNSEYNFYKTVKKIVKRFKNVEIFIIGIPESSDLSKKFGPNTARVHFLGPVSDPSDYYKAADICLETFPQPSIGAVFYSTLIGMSCPLFKYGISNVFNLNNLIGPKLYHEYIGNIKNEEQYLEKLGFLILNPNVRLEIAQEFREDYIKMNSGDIIHKNIKEMLDSVDNIEHSPKKIPDGFYYSDNDSAEIAGTSSFQDLYDIFAYFRKYLSIREKIVILLLLSIKFICFADVLKLALISLRNKIRTLYLGLFRRKRVLWPE